jgi:FKBP-type peptidyl-prolyl cis-trans isomerase
MKKILLVISIITFLYSCQKDFSVWKNYNYEKLQQFEANLGKSSDEIDTCWKSSTGLLVEVYHRGFGAIPKPASIVVCRYSGWLVDGKMFDYSDSGSSFSVGTVIAGWQEILCQMPQGSHFRIYVPYQLGYGKTGSKNTKEFIIPPYSTLIFDMEIIEVDQNMPN